MLIVRAHPAYVKHITFVQITRLDAVHISVYISCNASEDGTLNPEI